MRHIRLPQLIQQIFADKDGQKLKRVLAKAHLKLVRKTTGQRAKYLKNSGPKKWSPLKDRITSILGKKCWYTDVELTGAPLAVDHYRPKCDYWWLAFDPDNYRIACPYANSSTHNPAHGCLGGKGDEFPLLGAGERAKGKNKLHQERPVILDPCNPNDCSLVAFQADGRPVIHPDFAGDAVAVDRLERSKILLNIDHPEFNSKREQLYHDIADDVKAHEDHPGDMPLQTTIRQRLARRVDASAPFCMAAKQYLQMHRHLDWVEQLLAA